MNATQKQRQKNLEQLLGATLYLMTQYARVFSHAPHDHKEHLRMLVTRHLECIADSTGMSSVLHEYCDQLSLDWDRARIESIAPNRGLRLVSSKAAVNSR